MPNQGAVTIQSVALVRHEEETLELAKLFEEILCKLVKNFKHLYDIKSPGHWDKQMLENSWEEIGWELIIGWQQRASGGLCF